MAIERESFVLSEDVHLAKIGVNAVGEGDIDDAVVSPEGHGGLGTIAGEREKTLARASGQQDSECILHDLVTVL